MYIFKINLVEPGYACWLCKITQPGIAFARPQLATAKCFVFSLFFFLLKTILWCSSNYTQTEDTLTLNFLLLGYFLISQNFLGLGIYLSGRILGLHICYPELDLSTIVLSEQQIGAILEPACNPRPWETEVGHPWVQDQAKYFLKMRRLLFPL